MGAASVAMATVVMAVMAVEVVVVVVVEEEDVVEWVRGWHSRAAAAAGLMRSRASTAIQTRLVRPPPSVIPDFLAGWHLSSITCHTS